MPRPRFLIAGLLCFILVSFVPAAGIPLTTTTGVVVSANSSVIIIRPRNAEGQFEQAIPLKLRGTTRITAITTRRQGSKMVLVQNDTEARSVRKNQGIAVIFTTMGSERILLSAVVQPAAR